MAHPDWGAAAQGLLVTLLVATQTLNAVLLVV
jgi:hypothetical protein